MPQYRRDDFCPNEEAMLRILRGEVESGGACEPHIRITRVPGENADSMS